MDSRLRLYRRYLLPGVALQADCVITVRHTLVGLYAHRIAAMTKMYYLDPNNPDSTIIAMLGRFKNVAESP